jgi:hypothetical protein
VPRPLSKNVIPPLIELPSGSSTTELGHRRSRRDSARVSLSVSDRILNHQKLSLGRMAPYASSACWYVGRSIRRRICAIDPERICLAGASCSLHFCLPSEDIFCAAPSPHIA